jgi:hypothetical protein
VSAQDRLAALLSGVEIHAADYGGMILGLTDDDAAALADRLDRAATDRAALERVRALKPCLCGAVHLDDLSAALDGPAAHGSGGAGQ